MDSPDERVGQPFHHLVSQPGSHDLPDRAITGDSPDRPVRADQVEPGADCPAGREDAGPCQWPPPSRDAQDLALGHRPETAAHPEVGPLGGDRDQPVGDPELGDELGGLGTPAQEGVRGEVDGPSAELGRVQLAAPPATGLEHMDLGTLAAPGVPNQFPGRGQPGDTAADDGHHGRCVRPGRGHRTTAGTASRTTPASMSRKAGSSLREAVLANATPADRARSRASMSRS